MVAALLTRGADPNAPIRNWTPTRRSSRDFHFPTALIGATPFWLAARFTQPETMRLLVKHGANPLFVHRVKYLLDNLQPRTESTTALMAATGMGGGMAWVQIDAQDREAWTLEAVKLAAELGIDVNATNADGRTALDAARVLKYETVVKFLIDRGAKPGSR
jgi:ankyrin repeat protein